jgi:hypothetical protein
MDIRPSKIITRKSLENAIASVATMAARPMACCYTGLRA